MIRKTIIAAATWTCLVMFATTGMGTAFAGHNNGKGNKFGHTNGNGQRNGHAKQDIRDGVTEPPVTEPPVTEPPTNAGNLYGLLWCEGDIDFINNNTSNPIYISFLYTSPVDMDNFFMTDVQDAAIWELYEPSANPLPAGLSFNSALGRFEVTANDYFNNLTALEWNGPLFLQLDDGSSGIYNVDLNVETFNCLQIAYDVAMIGSLRDPIIAVSIYNI